MRGVAGLWGIMQQADLERMVLVVMAFESWWAWMILAAVFVIGEMLTAGFFLLWFGIGAALAGVLDLLGLSVGWQFAAFILISGSLFAVSRRFAERFTQKQPPGIGANRLIGKKGVVIERIDNIKSSGRVTIDGEEWRAQSESGDAIPADTTVEVVAVDGTRLVVKRLKEDE